MPPGNSDARARYTSRQAGLYKEELQRRVEDDARKNPHGIHIDGLELTPLAGASTPANGDDDFFTTWDKAPASKPATTKSTASPAGPPGIGARTSSGPRTVTSSSLRNQPVTRTTSAPRVGGAGPKVSKLGAKKATTSINFEEAQRKAQEEEERIKRLGYDKKREEDEAKAVKEREAAERKAKGEQISRTSTPSTTASSIKREVVDDKPAVARLGFGQTIGKPVSAQPKTWVPVCISADITVVLP